MQYEIKVGQAVIYLGLEKASATYKVTQLMPPTRSDSVQISGRGLAGFAIGDEFK